MENILTEGQKGNKQQIWQRRRKGASKSIIQAL